MKRPESTTTLSRFCSRICSFGDHWAVKSIFTPLLIGLPVLVLTRTAISNDLKFLEPLFSQKVLNWVSTSGLVVLILVYFFIVIGKLINGLLRSCAKPGRELDREDLDAILGCIETVVNNKEARFRSYAKNLLSGHTDNTETFEVITQPEQQMALLIVALSSTFDYIDKTNASFEVGLLKVESNLPVEWAFYAPQGCTPSMTAELLQNPKSTVMHAINARDTIIIEDISKEPKKKNPRYLDHDNGRKGHGSILCCPLISQVTDQIEYVITILGDQKGVLAEDHEPLYDWILKFFRSRLLLEHSLLIIKDNSGDTRDEHTI